MPSKKTTQFSGRPPGTPNPDGRERIRRQTHNLYDALLRKGLAGNADAVRLCFEIIGEHPKLTPLAAAGRIPVAMP